MKTIHIHKASPIINHEPVESVSIIIDSELPDNRETTLEECRQFYDDQAEKLFNALSYSLPQGIIEPLIIKFMQQTISLYRGRME